MKKFALVGNNIGYSLSPLIHSVIYRELNICAEYIICDLPQNIPLNKIFNQNLDGFNVTRPYKSDIIPFLSGVATKCGSVNTVTRDKVGYSTDGDGFMLDARRLSLDLTVPLIYGTGGAARSVFYSVLNSGINADICGRNHQKAVQIANDFNGCLLSGRAAAMPAGDLAKSYSIVIDCTDSFLKIQVNTKNYYDLKYHNTHKSDVVGYDGLGMLIYQAILSDRLFLNKEIDAEYMFSIVSKQIKNQ